MPYISVGANYWLTSQGCLKIIKSISVIKQPTWLEKFGLVIMTLGLVFMILNDVWENNPIPGILKRNEIFLWGGLLIWALGTQKKPKEEDNE